MSMQYENCIDKHPIAFTWIYTQKVVHILEGICQWKKFLSAYFYVELYSQN